MDKHSVGMANQEVSCGCPNASMLWGIQPVDDEVRGWAGWMVRKGAVGPSGSAASETARNSPAPAWFLRILMPPLTAGAAKQRTTPWRDFGIPNSHYCWQRPWVEIPKPQWFVPWALPKPMPKRAAPLWTLRRAWRVWRSLPHLPRELTRTLWSVACSLSCKNCASSFPQIIRWNCQVNWK